MTGETWYGVDDVCALIERFDIDHALPSWPVIRWISVILQLFHPQAVALIRARDERMKEWGGRKPDQNAFEDRELEITAALDISIDDQMAAVQAALAAKS